MGKRWRIARLEGVRRPSGVIQALGLTAAGLLGLGAATPAMAEQGLISEVAIGAANSAHDLVGLEDNASEQGRLATLDVTFQKWELLDWMGSPRPFVGVAVSLSNYTNFLSAGLVWRYTFGPVYLDVGAGGALHDGYVDLPQPEDGLPLAENQRRRRMLDKHTEFGRNSLFHARFAVGYTLSEEWGVELGTQHWSNGNLGNPTNDGADLLEVRVARRF